MVQWVQCPALFTQRHLPSRNMREVSPPLPRAPMNAPTRGPSDDGVFEASAKDTPPPERVSSRMVEPLPKAVHLLQVPLVVPLDCLCAPVAKQQPARKPASSPTGNSQHGQYSAKRHHNIYVPIYSLGPNELPMQVHDVELHAMQASPICGGFRQEKPSTETVTNRAKSSRGCVRARSLRRSSGGVLSDALLVCTGWVLVYYV